MPSRPHPAGSNRVRIFRDRPEGWGEHIARPWTWSCLHTNCGAHLYESYGRAETWTEVLYAALVHVHEYHEDEHLPHDLYA